VKYTIFQSVRSQYGKEVYILFCFGLVLMSRSIVEIKTTFIISWSGNYILLEMLFHFSFAIQSCVLNFGYKKLMATNLMKMKSSLVTILV
jgi:hypothetical protein